MSKKELETREKLKLTNIAKDWLRTEHSEGNIQSLVNLILSFIEPREKRLAELETQVEKMKEKLKADLIAKLKEQMQYSTSPSCTKGMELFIKSIDKWEIKENEK